MEIMWRHSNGLFWYFEKWPFRTLSTKPTWFFGRWYDPLPHFRAFHWKQPPQWRRLFDARVHLPKISWSIQMHRESKRWEMRFDWCISCHDWVVGPFAVRAEGFRTRCLLTESNLFIAFQWNGNKRKNKLTLMVFLTWSCFALLTSYYCNFD